MDELSCLIRLYGETNQQLLTPIRYGCRYELYGRDLWIGYHKVNGSWLWHDGTASEYDAFADGYPELYDCARSSELGVWKDRSCDDLQPYACERPACEFL